MRLVDPPEAQPIDPSELALSTYALYSFLEDPLQGWAQVVLRIAREEGEDLLAIQDERFGTRAQLRDSFLREVFYASLRDPSAAIEACYHRQADRLELLGELPTGVFGRSERARHLATLANWKRELRRAARGRRGPIDPIRFGRAAEHDFVARREPALEIPVENGTVQLSGKTQARIEDPSTSMVFFGRAPKGRADRHYELRGFLDQVVLAATGLHDGANTVHLAYSEGEPSIARFEPISAGEARSYLSRLASTLLFDTHAYALSFDTVDRVMRAKQRSERQRILDDARPSRWGPLRDPPVEAPPFDDALEMIEARFGLYYERRQGDPR
jgi:hypothetical protein